MKFLLFYNPLIDFPVILMVTQRHVVKIIGRLSRNNPRLRPKKSRRKEPAQEFHFFTFITLHRKNNELVFITKGVFRNMAPFQGNTLFRPKLRLFR